jgi:hypothetical protein
VVSAVVSVLVEVPSDSEVPLVPVASAVPAVPPELADAVSSAIAMPGVVATAMPTPSATANPPTRPMYFALLMVVPSAVPLHGWEFECWFSCVLISGAKAVMTSSLAGAGID